MTEKELIGGNTITEFPFILFYAVISGLVIEIAVILFPMTRLEKVIARYQVISMLTGTGFTTDESALILITQFVEEPVCFSFCSGISHWSS